MTAAKKDYGFVAYDDLTPYKDKYGFVPYPNQIERQPEVPQQEPSMAQTIASHPITQAGLGLAKAFTFPLDLLKMAVIGEGLSGVDEIESAYEKQGLPFDRQKFLEEAQRVGSYVPTQQAAEDFIKEKTGVNLEPQDTISKIARGGGELFALTPGSVVRRGLGAVTGAGAAEGLKQAGVPEPLADIAGAGVAGVASTGKIVPKTVTGEAQQAREVAEKHGLRKFAGAETEKAPKIAPIVSEAKEKVLRKELGETTQKAVNDIIEQKLPIKKARDQGVDLEQAYTQAFDRTRKEAASITAPINIDPVRNWINQEIKSIKASALSPSSADKAALKILNEEKKALKKNPTASQLINQYQNYNSNVKGIYKKPEFSGAENEVRRIYRELNDKLVDSVKTSQHPELAKMFQASNKLFHETSKLNQVEGILSKAFQDGYDPKKLIKLMEGKRSRAYLERSLGKDALNDLVDIGRYGQMAEKRVFDYLKHPKTVGEYINKLTPLSLALLVGKKSVMVPFAMIKAPINRIQGHLFTRDATRKSYINLLKSAGSPATMLRAAKALEQSVADEFGSEADFIKMVEEEGEE